MKKIISVLVILAVFVMILTLTACKGKTENGVRDELTTLKDDATSMLDELSSSLDKMEDELTEDGNITKDNSSTGLFETMTTESTTEASSAADKTTDITSHDSALTSTEGNR